MMLYYQWIILAALTLILLMELSNLFYLSRTRRSFPPAPPEILVSVLIPARNEEKNIARCLRGISDQTHANLEILVLDDGSTDRTAQIVTEHAQGDSRIKLITAEALPQGWTGKSHALHQLAQVARGEWLFLTDADDRHTPLSLEKGLAYAQARNLDLVTGYPQQRTGGFWEANLVPLLFFFITLFQPLWLVRRAHNPNIAVANGQYLLIKRDTYKKIGGHEAVHNIVNEDLALIKLIKKAGGRVDIMDLRGLVYCRMYRGFGEALSGFSKNIYLIMGRNPVLLWLAVIALTMLFLLPFAFLGRSFAIGNIKAIKTYIIAGQVLLVFFIRAVLAGYQRMSFVAVWFHPLNMLLYIYIFIRSFWEAEFGKGPQWKGRSYDVKRRDEGFA